MGHWVKAKGHMGQSQPKGHNIGRWAHVNNKLHFGGGREFDLLGWVKSQDNRSKAKVTKVKNVKIPIFSLMEKNEVKVIGPDHKAMSSPCSMYHRT